MFQEYNVKVNPIQTLPISLLLIDDYIATNVIVGLKCCIATFNTLVNLYPSVVHCIRLCYK